jgi:hypothetical protein
MRAVVAMQDTSRVSWTGENQESPESADTEGQDNIPDSITVIVVQIAVLIREDEFDLFLARRQVRFYACSRIWRYELGKSNTLIIKSISVRRQ